jgi:hypothetical protein
MSTGYEVDADVNHDAVIGAGRSTRVASRVWPKPGAHMRLEVG